MKTFLIFFILLLSSCGGLGGTEAGNPPTVTVASLTGTVSSTDNSVSALVFSSGSSNCFADLIIATDSEGNQSTATPNSSCIFTLDLTAGKAFQIALYEDDEFVSYLKFLKNRETQGLSQSLFLPNQELSINLGRISLSELGARPELEPGDLIDADDDGLFDLDDDDDNDDGTNDDEELDCDLDGFEDDYDLSFDDEFDCDDGEEFQPGDVVIFHAEPRQGEQFVDVDAEISFRASCEIDESTLTSSKFRVRGPGDVAVACDYSTQSGGDEAVCEPSSELASDATYRVTVEGVACEGGALLPVVTWQFTTE
ncbi:MAG: Ig-like domain-containing protein [Deltaproteobacteria bacterium]|nr:Ig-like domain-containing protein [Deltaproteobacteria bacterium]